MDIDARKNYQQQMESTYNNRTCKRSKTSITQKVTRERERESVRFEI